VQPTIGIWSSSWAMWTKLHKLSSYLFLHHAKFGCSLLRGRCDHEAEELSAWQEDNGRVHSEAGSPRRVILAYGMRESVRQRYLTKR
jgi:hypothetical protein